MSQNSNSTTLPTARKSRRVSRHKRPVLVSSTTQGTQEFQESQVETSEPEISNAPAGTEPLAEASVTTEAPAKARRAPHLPSFFSKVEKTVEESETSQAAVVKARLARAQKTTAKAELTPAASETKEPTGKPARGANRTGTTASPNKLFKTRHFIGMMLYLFGAEVLLPLETSFFRQIKIEQTLAQFTLFNIPMVITTSVLANLATLVIFLLILVKLDLLPSSMGGRTAATARAQKQQREQGTAADRVQQQTVRQGVKGEHDDLYYAYRSNQRKEKKH
jgi:hypothetical protein